MRLTGNRYLLPHPDELYEPWTGCVEWIEEGMRAGVRMLEAGMLNCTNQTYLDIQSSSQISRSLCSGDDMALVLARKLLLLISI